MRAPSGNVKVWLNKIKEPGEPDGPNEPTENNRGKELILVMDNTGNVKSELTYEMTYHWK